MTTAGRRTLSIRAATGLIPGRSNPFGPYTAPPLNNLPIVPAIVVVVVVALLGAGHATPAISTPPKPSGSPGNSRPPSDGGLDLVPVQRQQAGSDL